MRKVRQKSHIEGKEGCSVARCRNIGAGIILAPEGKRERRLCEAHFYQYCQQTHGISELEEWLAKKRGTEK